jgi:tetratricopeptide (TPR) repeat protein
MLEATCTACGTVNHVADADVPVGAKFVNCASCKSRVAIPVKTAANVPPPQSEALDLADLPAPRRPSALGAEAAKPAPRSGLAAAELADLPAPRAAPKKPLPPPPAGAPLDLDDILGAEGVDLPAPKREAGAPPPRLPSIADTAPVIDLPAPKPKSPLTDLPAPKPKASIPSIPRITPPALPRVDLPPPPPPVSDLPSPKGKPPASPVAARPAAGIVDLPSPKPTMDLPLPKPGGGIVDLPSPKPGGAVIDLPQPKAGGGIVDLPSPKPQPKAGGMDLPSPKPQARAAGMDLPSPKSAGIADLPQPKGAIDLPEPKGSMTDLQPKPGGAGDLPAPKGFFEDLPQPARNPQGPGEVAPKGFFEDLPQSAGEARQGGGSDVPAPKGFFEDLPGRPTGQPRPEVPAPKGFFEDLPGRPTGAPRPEVPAPKGFFDDLPAKPSTSGQSDVPAPKGFFDDLPKPAKSSAEVPLDSLELDPVQEHSNSAIELELGDDAPAARMKPPSVAPAPGPSNQFDDLDLSSPSPVSFSKGKTSQSGVGVATISAASAAAAKKATISPLNKSGDVSLELEEPRPSPGGVVSKTAKLGPKQAARKKPVTAESRARTRKIALIAVVVLAALGAGGFYAYRHFAKKAAQEAAVNEQLDAARKAITASQWSKAQLLANKTLELDKTNAEALGIKAEALFALGIVEGGNAGRFGQARKSLAEALKAAKSHPALERAQAVSPIAANQPKSAIDKLTPLANAAPKDAALQLYLGWAQGAYGDYDAAIKSFDRAIASQTLKVHALLGRGRAKQAKGDSEGARADYVEVINAQKDHIGAQVGIASTLPASQSQQAESDLKAILVIKDVENKDRRAAIDAWILLGQIAAKSGRLDEARERFRKALAIQNDDVRALIGTAEVELTDKKVDVASEQVERALKSAPQSVPAQLLSIEIAIMKKKLDDAAKRLDALAKRNPPPPVIEQARIKMLTGRLLEAQDKEQDALEAYTDAAKLAGDQDLTPTLIAASRINAMADKAATANDAARASELRKKADELLGGLAETAEKDPNLALTLGMAYLQANDPVKAESWLRKAVEKSPTNVDAHYQLAKALARQAKDDGAIASLRTAIELDPTRTEIGLELARTYEEAKRTQDAEKLYEKLLAAKEPTIELRARAGRFFAKVGSIDKAAEQGAEILKVQDDNPAGLYLKGEGLLKANKTDAARKVLALASDVDPEAQYLDGRGRAAEALARDSGNTAYQDEAIRAYDAAAKKDPTIFSAWRGLGALYVLRKEDRKAIEPLQKAWALQETAEVARLMGTALKNVGNQPKNAAGWLEKSNQMEDNKDTSWQLGQLYTDPGVNSPKGAIAAVDKAIRLADEETKKSGAPAPTWYPDALYMLGDLNFGQNNWKAAKTAWTKWLGLNPKATKAKIDYVKQQLNTTLRDQ